MSPDTQPARASWLWVLLPSAALFALVIAISLLTRNRSTQSIPTPTIPATTTPTVPDTSTPSPQATAVPIQTTYIVMPGDTLASIAEWFNLPPEAIMEANHLTSTGEIYPGQSLVIPQLPQATATPTPSPLPASPK